MPTRFAIPAATALALLSAAPTAVAGWTAPQRFAGPGAAQVFAAANRHGSQILVWNVDSKRVVRLGPRTGLAGWVRARIRLPSGTLGRAATISSTKEIVFAPQAGVDENANVTAVWVQAGRHVRIMAAYHPHGKPFGKPVEIGRTSVFASARPTIAVGRFGDAVIAWNDGRHIAVRRRAGNAQCTPARHFACYRPATLLRGGAGHTVAIGPLGSAYIAWAAMVRSGDEAHSHLRMVVIRRSGRRSLDHAISRAGDGDASEPAVAIRRDGTADLAWRASLPTTEGENLPAPILAAASSPDAVVSPPQAISAFPGDGPSIRDTRDEAIVTWSQFRSTPQNPDGEEVAYAVRTAGAPAFGPPAVISAPGMFAAGPSLAVDAAGGAIIAYLAAPAIGPAPSGVLGMSHARPAGGAFGSPVVLPGSALNRVVVFGAGPKISAYTGDARGLAITDWRS